VIARKTKQPRQIGDKPDPYREDFPSVTGKCRHVGDQATIVKEGPIGRRRSIGPVLDQRTWKKCASADRQQRTYAVRDKGRAPAEGHVNNAGNHEGNGAARRIAGGVDAGRAPLMGSVDPIHQQVEAGHMDTGEGDAAKKAKDQREAKSLRECRECQSRRCAEQGAAT